MLGWLPPCTKESSAELVLWVFMACISMPDEVKSTIISAQSSVITLSIQESTLNSWTKQLGDQIQATGLRIANYVKLPLAGIFFSFCKFCRQVGCHKLVETIRQISYYICWSLAVLAVTAQAPSLRVNPSSISHQKHFQSLFTVLHTGV